jgi:hypothetical protein
MPERSSKRPRDVNQFAAKITELATEGEKPEPDSGKNPAAVALGRLGGNKGGPARAAKLTAEQRKQIAQGAARKRWGNLCLPLAPINGSLGCR